MQFLLLFPIVFYLCMVAVHPHLLGVGGMQLQQREMSQSNQMENALGVNLTLGLSTNSYSRSSRMNSERMKRIKRAVYINKAKSCFIIVQIPSIKMTTVASTTTADIDPRVNNTQA
ncbi:uncharacterized protein LOC130445376 [Diorhabda sublineata]|uniref:uncharacterized protein LOC130445376 n=1 Tax=Diorhabda sublineata TaxID=1163346 RepID=UPI0024E0FAEB|nr:uncharacterized protein LOC130445376 [Diorhabda sublineata]